MEVGAESKSNRLRFHVRPDFVGTRTGLVYGFRHSPDRSADRMASPSHSFAQKRFDSHNDMND